MGRQLSPFSGQLHGDNSLVLPLAGIGRNRCNPAVSIGPAPWSSALSSGRKKWLVVDLW